MNILFHFSVSLDFTQLGFHSIAIVFVVKVETQSKTLACRLPSAVVPGVDAAVEPGSQRRRADRNHGPGPYLSHQDPRLQLLSGTLWEPGVVMLLGYIQVGLCLGTVIVLTSASRFITADRSEFWFKLCPATASSFIDFVLFCLNLGDYVSMMYTVLSLCFFHRLFKLHLYLGQILCVLHCY